MKYLNSFNEGVGVEDQKKLLYFCEELLVSFLDENYTLNVGKTYGDFKKTMKIDIIMPPKNTKDWYDIKDIFIHFLIMLKRNYNIGLHPNQSYTKRRLFKRYFDPTISFFSIGNKIKKVNIDDVINDNVDIKDIYTIIILVHNKIE